MGKTRIIIAISIVSVLVILIISGIILFFATRTTEPNFGGTCGDNICGFGETTSNCLKDCNIDQPPLEFCGDEICQMGETQRTCSQDCGLPLPECGNEQCQVFTFGEIHIDEFISCPEDCGIVCGDGECVIDPFDERLTCEVDCGAFGDICGDNLCELTESPLSCPQDCPVTDASNDDLIYQLNQKQRPLVGGLSIKMPRGENFALCTLGAIVNFGGSRFILTAGHCVTEGADGFPDPDDIGLQIRQGDEIIGSVFKTDFTGGVDAALISINGGINSKLENFLGDEIMSFGSNSDIFDGQKVFKVGKTTGLTFGTIRECPTCSTRVEYTDLNGNKIQGFTVSGDGKKFSESGDSGSAIITVSKPHKIIGIISAGDGSNLPDDIRNKLGI